MLGGFGILNRPENNRWQAKGRGRKGWEGVQKYR